jgi:hypothetical protein
MVSAESYDAVSRHGGIPTILAPFVACAASAAARHPFTRAVKPFNRRTRAP